MLALRLRAKMLVNHLVDFPGLGDGKPADVSFLSTPAAKQPNISSGDPDPYWGSGMVKSGKTTHNPEVPAWCFRANEALLFQKLYKETAIPGQNFWRPLGNFGLSLWVRHALLVLADALFVKTNWRFCGLSPFFTLHGNSRDPI